MLTRIRIEVEEETAEACVEALWKYEHALVQQEIKRYRHLWPVSVTEEDVEDAELREYPTPNHPWSDDIAARSFANGELGREVTEEIIEYVEGASYRGRRVVRYERIDMRRAFLGQPYFEFTVSGPGVDSTARPL